LKALGLRLAVFLQQNNLTPKSLIAKLVETKRASNPGCNEEISLKFFGKFIKAKVDKKPELPAIISIVTQMDIDRDGLIGESDLEAFLGRVNFTNAFKKASEEHKPTSSAIVDEAKGHRDHHNAKPASTIGMFP
jgi:hypothetical protein